MNEGTKYIVQLCLTGSDERLCDCGLFDSRKEAEDHVHQYNRRFTQTPDGFPVRYFTPPIPVPENYKLYSGKEPIEPLRE